MRFAVFGAGAIGGVLGARLHEGGFEVTLIARGAHYQAIRERGLTLETPDASTELAIPVVEDPGGVEWGGDEVVLLAVKTQDAAGALAALRAAAPASIAVVCAQNGVESERLALRLFANVYGAVVMAPTAHMEPGIVQAYGTRLSGIIDVGRYPDGLDARCEAIAGALGASHFSSEARPDIMRFKYAKLIVNLGNAATAICEPGEAREELIELAREEGRAALRAAAIEFAAEDVDDVQGRWRRFGVREIEGRRRVGSSTWQSIARGAAGIETDYLNGEIVLLGRLHGVRAPLNEALCALSDRHLREGRAPETLAPAAVIGYASEREALWTR